MARCGPFFTACFAPKFHCGGAGGGTQSEDHVCRHDKTAREVRGLLRPSVPSQVIRRNVTEDERLESEAEELSR